MVADDAVCMQASYVAARRYAVIDIGTSPCPIRSGGNVGGEEGVVAEVTLPMLRQAVAMPEGTHAVGEIIGGALRSTSPAFGHIETQFNAGRSRSRYYDAYCLRGPASFPARY